MTHGNPNASRQSRTPLVAAPAVIAVRSRPYLAYALALVALGAAGYAWKMSVDLRALEKRDYAALVALEKKAARGALTKDKHAGEQTELAHHQFARPPLTAQAAVIFQEANFYLQLAQQRLSLHNDAAGARELLHKADQLLAQQAEARTQPLRTAIAQDQLALAEMAAFDTAGIYARLAALSERVDTFTQTAAAPSEASEKAISAPAAPEKSALKNPAEARSIFAQSWQTLRGLIQVRHYDTPISPLQSTAARAQHQQHIQLLLAQAQMALLQQEPRIFVSAVSAARLAIAQHFPHIPSAQYRAVLHELSALAAVPVSRAARTLRSLHASHALQHSMAAAQSTPAATKSGAAP